MQSSPDPRLPKAKANALPSMHPLRRHLAPSRLRRTHSLLSPQLSTTSLRLLSRLCIIPRQAFLATSFTLLSRSTAARCSSFQHPALHLPTDAIPCSTKSTFPQAPAFGLPKKKNGGGDTWSSWIEQRHRQSNLHHRDTFFHHHLYNYFWAYYHSSASWLQSASHGMVGLSVGHRSCGIAYRRCRLLLAHRRAGRSREPNGRGGRHLDYRALLRVSLSGFFLLSLVIIRYP